MSVIWSKLSSTWTSWVESRHLDASQICACRHCSGLNLTSAEMSSCFRSIDQLKAALPLVTITCAWGQGVVIAINHC